MRNARAGEAPPERGSAVDVVKAGVAELAQRALAVAAGEAIRAVAILDTRRPRLARRAHPSDAPAARAVAVDVADVAFGTRGTTVPHAAAARAPAVVGARTAEFAIRREAHVKVLQAANADVVGALKARAADVAGAGLTRRSTAEPAVRARAARTMVVVRALLTVHARVLDVAGGHRAPVEGRTEQVRAARVGPKREAAGLARAAAAPTPGAGVAVIDDDLVFVVIVVVGPGRRLGATRGKDEQRETDERDHRDRRGTGHGFLQTTSTSSRRHVRGVGHMSLSARKP